MPLKASVFTAFLCIIFGANAVAIKFSLAGLGTFTNLGLRFSIAGVFIFLWAKYNKKSLKIKKQQILPLLLLSSFFLIQSSLFYMGLSKTSVSHGTLIANLLPFFVLVLAHYFIPGDNITLKKGLGVTIGFLGIVVLFFEADQVSGDFMIGDLIILLAVFFWALNAIYAKKIILNFSSLQITFYPMVFAIPSFFILACFFDTQMIKTIDTTILGALFYQSFIATTFGFVAWNILLRKFGTTSLFSFVFLLPLAGVFFGVLLLDEPLTHHILISITLIVSGIIIVNK